MPEKRKEKNKNKTRHCGSNPHVWIWEMDATKRFTSNTRATYLEDNSEYQYQELSVSSWRLLLSHLLYTLGSAYSKPTS